nr:MULTISPECIES: ACP S-malonyltransferase [Mycobacteriaceae]
MLAPGQGSQTPGMLQPWLDLPAAGERLATWSQISGLDLARLGTTATAEEITDTAVTQPLVVAATLLAHEEAVRRLGERSDGGTTGSFAPDTETIVAGHSVGEIAAYAIAGIISADDAVKLAATRGAEMAKACALEPTGMAAVLGGDEASVLEALDRFDLIPANRNAAGQIVAAGAVAALEKLAEDPPAKARVRVLATAGAFHTHYMASALDGYAAAAESVVTADALEPNITLLSNSDGQPVTSPGDAIEKLVAQLTRPVRWDLCTATMREREPAGIVEFPPAGTLVGIAKRELKGVPTRAVKTPADLDGLAEL